MNERKSWAWILGSWLKRPWAWVTVILMMGSILSVGLDAVGPHHQRRVLPEAFGPLDGWTPHPSPLRIGTAARDFGTTGRLRNLGSEPGRVETLRLLPMWEADGPLDLHALSHLPHLQELDLSEAMERETDLSPLADLSRLRVLVTPGWLSVSDEQLADVARVPSLKRWVAGQEVHGTPLELGALRASATLREVVVPVEPRNFGATRRRLAEHLPGVAAVPGATPRVLELWIAFWFWTTPLSTGSLNAVLNGWLHGPAAAPLPGGRRRHRRVLGGLAAAAWLLLAAMLFAGGWAWLPALSVGAAVAAVTAWITVRGISREPSVAGERRVWVSNTAATLALLAGLWLALRQAGDAWLAETAAGIRPLPLVGLFGFAALVAWRCGRLVMRPRERTPGTEPALAPAREREAGEGTTGSSGPWPLRNRPAHPWFAWTAAAAIAGGTAWAAWPWPLAPLRSVEDPEILPLLASLALFVSLLLSLGHLAQRWYARLGTLPLRFPLPGNRRAHTDAWLREAAGELRLLWPLLPAAALLGAVAGAIHGQPLLLTLLYPLLALAAAATMAAGTLLRPPSVPAAVLVVGWALGLFGGLVFVGLGMLDPANVAVVATLALAVGVVGIAFARDSLIASEHPPA